SLLRSAATRLWLLRQPSRQGPDVSRIAAAAAADVTDAFPPRASSEFLEFKARDLDCFQAVRKRRLAGEAMAFVRRAKGSGLRGDGPGHSSAHFAKQWQHSFGLPLAIGAAGNGPAVGPHLRVVCGQVAVECMWLV